MNIPPPEQAFTLLEDRLQTIKERLDQRQRIPLSTYRLQFNSEFTFQQAVAVVPYLSRLGVSHGYASPYFAAGKGSSHGYDISDYNRINPEIGSDEDFHHFLETLSSEGMGHILDFVPNHMGIASPQNQWWQDVLENGRCSPFANFFDIDWDPIKVELKGKILLPILGDQYGVVLERGELKLTFEDGGFYLHYYEFKLPITPNSVPLILAHDLERLKKRMPTNDDHLREFLSIIRALKNLPPVTDTDPEKIEERRLEKEVGRTRLVRLMNESSVIREHIERNIRILNGEPGQPESFDLLHNLLEQQIYRISNWRTASHEINYRRFFDINHLAGLRMERPEVFQSTHKLVLKLIGQGKINGLRLDHTDGLFNPLEYFERLQESALFEYAVREPVLNGVPPETLRQALRQWRGKEKQSDPAGPIARPLYLVPEKILTGNESLPEHWAVHGTSGYDFMNDVNELFVNAVHEKQFTRIYTRFTGNTLPFSEIVYQSKKLIMQTALASELNVLVRSLNLISEEDRHYRDFTLNSLRETLMEVVACFPLYRTYIDPSGYTPEDRDTLEASIRRARSRNPALEPTIFEFIKDTLRPPLHEGSREDYGKKQLDFILKFQQFTGPVQAKGLEDTAFYRYYRLVSLNEVGGAPQRFGLTVAGFHARHLKRQRHWPWTLNATATHDHKRGEDVRARINILSEIPEEWRKAVGRWSLLNRGKRTLLEGEYAPDRNDEYIFYQVLIGMWPPRTLNPDDFEEVIQRLITYMHKATKEAKVHTSWVNPNQSYDEAIERFIQRTLSPSKSNRFLDSFLPFQARVAKMGVVNSLAQALLKITSPGIPDFYQGTELWDLSLVDPDNRRPVDFPLREKYLEELEPLLDDASALESRDREKELRALLDQWPDGRVKLYLTACGLRWRRAHPLLFLDGDYLPLQVEGNQSDHVVAFARHHEGKTSLTVAPRLVVPLMEPDLKWPVGPSLWEDTRILIPNNLPLPKTLVDRITHRPVALGTHNDQRALPMDQVFSIWPVALLGGEV